MLDKGKISSITADGKAIVIPSDTDEVVTFPLVIPTNLDGMLSVNDYIVYAMFDDNTGIVLGRMDGIGGNSGGGGGDSGESATYSLRTVAVEQPEQCVEIVLQCSTGNSTHACLKGDGTTSVYYDESDGKVHINTPEIAVDASLSATSENPVQNMAVQKKFSSLENEMSNAFTEVKALVDVKIADLINGAPTTLDTLGEIAEAMADNADIVQALEAAIGNKANVSDLGAVAAEDIVPYNKGGTDATTVEIARQNMNYMGSNLLSSSAEDTPAFWVAKKTGVTLFNQKLLKQQPYQYGFMRNLCSNGTTVLQEFIATTGSVYRRAGTSGSEWADGGRWVVGFDSENVLNQPIGINAIMSGCSVAKTLSTSLSNVNCGNIYARSGELFSLSDGGIKCEVDGTVLATAQLAVTGLTAGNAIYCAIVKNSTQLALSYAQSGTRTYTHAVNQKLINVKAGDVLYLYASNPNEAIGTVAAANTTSLTAMYVG